MLVRDVMNTRVETIRPETSVFEAAQRMRDGDFGVLPVLDGENVIGMITDRDLAIRVLAEGKDANDMTVECVMTPEVLFCQADDTIDSATDYMAERQVRRLVVMNEDKKICGILSVGDVALVHQNEAGDAISGISERRHDEPGAELNH